VSLYRKGLEKLEVLLRKEGKVGMSMVGVMRTPPFYCFEFREMFKRYLAVICDYFFFLNGLLDLNDMLCMVC